MNSKKALVVIDIQNYFIDECTKPLLNKITKLIESSNFVLFSKFMNNSDSNFYKSLKWEKCETSSGIDIQLSLSKKIIYLINQLFQYLSLK
jgi:nicotinamidase-related amidase